MAINISEKPVKVCPLCKGTKHGVELVGKSYLGIRLTPSLIAQLEEFAERQSTSRTAVICRAIKSKILEEIK